MDSFELIVEILQGHGLYASSFLSSIPYIQIYVNEAHIGTCDFFPKTVNTWNDTYRCHINQIAQILLTFKVYEVSLLGLHRLLGSSKIPFTPQLKNSLQWHSTNTTTISNYGEIEFRLTLQPKYLTRISAADVFHDRRAIKQLHCGYLHCALQSERTLLSHCNDFPLVFCLSSSVLMARLHHLTCNHTLPHMNQSTSTISGVISALHSLTNKEPHLHFIELHTHEVSCCRFISGDPVTLDHVWRDDISPSALQNSGMMIRIYSTQNASACNAVRKEYFSYLSLYSSGIIREISCQQKVYHVIENNLSFAGVSPRNYNVSLSTPDDDNIGIVAVKFKFMELLVSPEDVDAVGEDAIRLPLSLQKPPEERQTYVKRAQTTICETNEQAGMGEYLHLRFEVLTSVESVLCDLLVPVVHISHAPSAVIYPLDRYTQKCGCHDILRHFHIEIAATHELIIMDDSTDGRVCLWSTDAYQSYVSEQDEYTAQIRWHFSPMASETCAQLLKCPIESTPFSIYCHDELVGEVKDILPFIFLDTADGSTYAHVFENQCFDAELGLWLPLEDIPYSNEVGDEVFPIFDDIHSVSLVADRICESDHLSEQCWTLFPVIRIIQGSIASDSWLYTEKLSTNDPLRMSSSSGCGYKFRRRCWRKQLFFNLHMGMNFTSLHHSITAEMEACMSRKFASVDAWAESSLHPLPDLLHRIKSTPQRISGHGRLLLNIDITKDSMLLRAISEKCDYLHSCIYSHCAQSSSYVIDSVCNILERAAVGGEIFYMQRGNCIDPPSDLLKVDSLMLDYQCLFHSYQSSSFAHHFSQINVSSAREIDTVYSSLRAGGGEIGSIVCFFEKVIFAVERQSLNQLCGYSCIDNHYYRNYENMCYSLRAAADGAIQKIVSVLSFYVKHPYPLDHQQRQFPWSEEFTPLSSFVLNNVARLYTVLILSMYRHPLYVLYPPCLHRYVKLSDVICWELRPRSDSVYQWVCNLRNGGLRTVLEVHSSRDSYGRVSVEKSPLKSQPSQVERTMHHLISVPETFEECILNDYIEAKRRNTLQDEDWCRMFLESPPGKNYLKASNITSRDIRNNHDGFLLECHRLHEEYIRLLCDLSDSDVLSGRVESTRITVAKPFSVAVTSDESYRESSFDVPVVPNSEIDFMLLLSNILRDGRHFMHLVRDWREQMLPPYYKFLENMSVSDHTYLRHLAAITSTVNSKLQEYEYLFAKLILRGSKLVEIFLGSKFSLPFFTQLSTNPNVHPLFPVPVVIQMQRPSPPLGQCLLCLYELCDVLRHHMRRDAYCLYQNACLSFIFRHFMNIVFDLYVQYQKTRKISINVMKYIEMHISEIKRLALEIYLFMCTLFIHLESELVSSKFLRILHVSQADALLEYTFNQWQTAFADDADAILCPALCDFNEAVAAWFNRIIQILTLSPKDLVDFRLLQEVFDASDTLRHTSTSTSISANDIIDNILTSVDLMSWKIQNDETPSKLRRIEISNIYIRRSVKIVAHNAPLVSRDDTTPVRHAQKMINSVLCIELVTLSGRVLNTFTSRVCRLFVTRAYSEQVLCDDANPVWLEVYVSDAIKCFLEAEDPVHCIVLSLYNRHFTSGVFASHSDTHIATARILLYGLSVSSMSQWHPMQSDDESSAYDIFARIAMSPL